MTMASSAACRSSAATICVRKSCHWQRRSRFSGGRWSRWGGSKKEDNELDCLLGGGLQTTPLYGCRNRDSWIPGLALLARNDGRVVFVIPALRLRSGQASAEIQGV